MSILVNGGAGFIGGYLDRLLLQRGEKVIVLDTTLDPSPMKLVLAPAEIEQLTLIQADVADAVALFRVVQEHRVRRIVHLVTYDFLKGELVPLEALRSNVQGLLTCFEAARMFGVERVVWAGSVQVFGQHTPYSKEFGGPLLDGGPHRPWTVYAACKSIMEYMGDHYHRKFGVDTRGLRPCGTFGPGRQPGLTAHISDMLKAAALGRPYTMPLGDYRLPHVYVEDTARGFEAALYHEGPELSGRTVNIGSYSTSRRQMVELARQVVPEADLTVEPGDGGESVTLPIDNSSLQRVTGFGLKYSLEEGVQASIEFFRRGGATGAAAG